MQVHYARKPREMVEYEASFKPVAKGSMTFAVSVQPLEKPRCRGPRVFSNDKEGARCPTFIKLD
jgi:hypothetical protein